GPSRCSMVGRIRRGRKSPEAALAPACNPSHRRVVRPVDCGENGASAGPSFKLGEDAFSGANPASPLVYMASTMVLPQRLKVLHVVDSLEFGGLERVVTDLALAQRAGGDDVAVFSINDTGGHRRTLEAAGITAIQGGKRSTADLGVLRALW